MRQVGGHPAETEQEFTLARRVGNNDRALVFYLVGKGWRSNVGADLKFAFVSALRSGPSRFRMEETERPPRGGLSENAISILIGARLRFPLSAPAEQTV